MNQDSAYEIVNLHTTSTRRALNNSDITPKGKDQYASLSNLQKTENEYQVPNSTTKVPRSDTIKNGRNRVLLAVAIAALIASTLAIVVALMGIGVYSSVLEHNTIELTRRIEQLEVELNATQLLLNTPVNIFHKCRVDTISNFQRIELGGTRVYTLETFTEFLPINVTVSFNCGIQ